MERLLINKLKKLQDSKISKIIDERLNSFKKKKSKEDLFEELCFCILAANYSSERSWEIQRNIHHGFFDLEEKHLAHQLKQNGYRFPNKRANYIVLARPYMEKIPDIIHCYKGQDLRNFFESNILGIGIKEASHFLRNIGFFDYAIIDFHILDILEKYQIIEKPKTLTRKKYLEIEERLFIIAKKLFLTQGELDLYLWYLETGKVLK